MISRQQQGYLFEDKIHILISQTKYKVLTNKDITKKYNNVLCSGIDHLIYTTDYIICIQDKWRDTKSQLIDINHFLKSIEYVVEAEKKECIAIYLTKVPITKGACEAFNYENTKHSIKYFPVYDENQELLIKKFSELLYSNQIYFYDSDDCLVMLS
jgi:hypothetical protein